MTMAAIGLLVAVAGALSVLGKLTRLPMTGALVVVTATFVFLVVMLFSV